VTLPDLDLTGGFRVRVVPEGKTPLTFENVGNSEHIFRSVPVSDPASCAVGVLKRLQIAGQDRVKEKIQTGADVLKKLNGLNPLKWRK